MNTKGYKNNHEVLSWIKLADVSRTSAKTNSQEGAKKETKIKRGNNNNLKVWHHYPKNWVTNSF
jgi:hypothetical protein